MTDFYFPAILLFAMIYFMYFLVYNGQKHRTIANQIENYILESIVMGIPLRSLKSKPVVGIYKFKYKDAFVKHETHFTNTIFLLLKNLLRKNIHI